MICQPYSSDADTKLKQRIFCDISKKNEEEVTMKEGNEILTREEVMELLKIGRSTFYKLIQEGKLKGYKDGNRFKVPYYAVEEYIEKRMKT